MNKNLAQETPQGCLGRGSKPLTSYLPSIFQMVDKIMEWRDVQLDEQPRYKTILKHMHPLEYFNKQKQVNKMAFSSPKTTPAH